MPFHLYGRLKLLQRPSICYQTRLCKHSFMHSRVTSVFSLLIERPSQNQCPMKFSSFWPHCAWTTYLNMLFAMTYWFGYGLILLQVFRLFLLLVHTSPVKRICVFKHSVMTNFNCACPAIQRGQGSGFLSECSSWLPACLSEQRRFWRDCTDAQARLNLRCSHRR